MTLYGCGYKQDAEMTFLAMCFCTVVEMNRNTSKKGRFNFEFSCIQVIPPV